MIYNVCAMAKLDRHKEAQEAAAKLMLRHPDFRISRLTFHVGKFTDLPDVSAELLESGLPL